MIQKNYTQVKEFISELGGELLSKTYENNSKVLLLKCPKCGVVFERNFSNIQQRKSVECKSCSYVSRAKVKIDQRSIEIKKYISSLGGILLKYNGEKKPLILFCPKCNKKFEKTLAAIRKSGLVECHDCVNEIRIEKSRTDIDVIRKFIENLGGELLSKKFTHSLDKLEVKCNCCGHSYLRSWKYIKDKENVTCPKCSNSKSLGTDKIIKLLLENNINFILEKTFEGCVDKGKLRFDFYIPKTNTCIEYDGRQHFYPYEAFGGSQQFEDRVKKDKIKTDFCIQHRINLIRISYKQFRNIKEVLIENKIIPSQAR